MRPEQHRFDDPLLQQTVERIDENVEEVLGLFIPGDMIPSLCGEEQRNKARPGWLPCNGASYSRLRYPRLAKAIGTKYGGSDTGGMFAVPDMQHLILVGVPPNEGLGDVHGGWATVGGPQDQMGIHVVWWIKT